MNDKLKAALLGTSATAKSVKDLATEINLSVSRTRELLNEDKAAIHCRKEKGQNLFWLPQIGDNDAFEASPDELAAQRTRQDVVAERSDDVKTDMAPSPTTAPTGAETSPTGPNETCPLCKAEAVQVQAGPEGSYLGAARTCSACSQTWNIHTKEKINMADETKKEKRQPLNPQYKIDAKVDVATKGGAKLAYERESRSWVLTKKGQDPIRMNAQEFSNETPESIAKRIGYTIPAAAPKAEKPAKAPKADKAPVKDKQPA